MEIKQALPKDKKIVNTILIDAAKWLQSMGSSQWSELLEGQDVHGTTKHIDEGKVYIAWDDNKPMGVFTLIDEPSEWDKDLWGEEDGSDYNYLHRIAINRAYSGQGLGGRLVQEALSMTKNDNKEGLRLDCNAESPALNKFYQSQGLEFIERKDNIEVGTGEIDLNLYQKEI